MSSEPPPDSPGKRGLRQALRSGFYRAKDTLRQSRDSRPPTGHQGNLSPPSLGSQLLSVFNRSSNTLARGPSPIGSDRQAIAAPPGSSIQAPVLDSTNKAVTEHKKSDSVAWTRLTSSLRVLENCVELFPPLKSAVGVFIGCLDIVQHAASNRTDYEQLTDEFQSMVNILSQYGGELELEPNSGSIANIAQCIQQHVADIERKGERGTVGRLANAIQDQEDVIQRYRQVGKLFRQLQCDLSMRTRSDVKKQLETTLLRGMYPVDDAKYDSGYSTTIRRRGCTAKTREAILQTLQDWATNPAGKKIYWMNGMAGTGKTTIAYSFCEWLEETNRLGASFFCSRISSTCRSLTQIVPTIAYQLARFSPGFRSNLCTILNDSPDAGKLNVVQQFDKLINRPMLQAKNALPDSVVIVIDALDECDDSYSVRLLLDLLLRFAESLPLKFFVSSRPESVIRERMMSQGGASRSIVYLHDIEQSIVEEDIKKYLTEALDTMTPPPPAKQIEVLAKRSRNLFIYAATVVRYIYPDDVSVDSSARLERISEAIGSARSMSNSRYEDLDLLYTTVLSAVFKKRLEKEEEDSMQRVLWTVVCAREPISAVAITSLAQLTERQVWSALQSLRSVVHVPESSSLISTLHASFPEYMLDESRSKGFYCSESKSNETMVHRCFDVMKSELKFNICGLDSSYLTDDQVDDLEARVARCISPTLSYACRYWASHLQVAPLSDDTHDMVLDFLSSQLLFWMEVLSLTRCIGIGAPMMQQAQTWLRIANNRDEIQKQTSDARNFLTWFAANPCSRSTPHIYVSALPLCAKSSWVYQHYFQHTSGLANISVSQHDESVLAVWTTESVVESVAISPDGNRLVSGSDDGSVQVYDIHTGALVAGPFQEHTRIVWSVSFSPDGRYIASGSGDRRVIIWDAHTGRIVTGPLHEHTDTVWSVAFSPDGRHVVSGSDDKTIIVWDAFTGDIVYGPLEGHSSQISSVAYSPDGHLIASGSRDKTIRLWDASTGAAVAESLVGHQDRVATVVFSPDGSQLASCSNDKTIRVWDIKTGTAIGMPFEGHRSNVWCLGFSNNGSWIVSGGQSGDHDIRIWDIRTGSVVLGPLSGHTDYVGSVIFTPDDTRIVSCSNDHTIRIRDAQQKARAPDQESTPKHSAGPIAFMHDCTEFITNSSSGTLQLWDTCTGMNIQREFEGQTELTSPHSIAVSPQQTLVAVGVGDFTTRVWDVLTGKLVSQPLKGHKGLARCLSFSPDGARLCSGSDDTTIIVWDVGTGAMAGQPYIGHTRPVVSLAFSPDAKHIASGSTDCTVRIWDSSASLLVHTLDEHSTSVSSVAFSPDGSYVISGSVDGAIRKWEAETGNCLKTLFEPRASSYTSPNSDRAIPVHWVCFSPDGAYIASAFGSSVRLVDSQNSDMVSELSFPSDEQVHWVGYTPNGSDIVTVSCLEGTETKVPANKSTQAPIQSPNVIRVWYAADATKTEQQASFLAPRSWSYKPDGRVLSPEGLVMWIPPDLIPHMEEHTSLGSESHYSSVVWSPDRFINIGYPDLCIGNRWTECYASSN